MTELGSSIDKMHRDKVALESQMEMEEEGIVNRLNRCAFAFLYPKHISHNAPQFGQSLVLCLSLDCHIIVSL